MVDAAASDSALFASLGRKTEVAAWRLGLVYPLFRESLIRDKTMSPKKTSSAPADKLELYEKLIRTDPKIERKGATMPYTSLNGNMFTLLDSSGTMALRLSEE